MPHRLILQITGEFRQRVEIPPGRCSIGRSDDNDLVINAAGISRRHAIVTNLDSSVQVTDCGSQNGTYVNGRQVESAVELVDGDLLSLGTVCEIQVVVQPRGSVSERGSSLEATPRQSEQGSAFEATPRQSERGPSFEAAPRQNERPRASFARLARKDRSGRLSAPVIAGISIAAIVLITALVLLALQLRGSSHTSYTINDYPPDPSPTAAPVTLRPCQDLTIAEIEEAARGVVGRICNDPRPYDFPSDKTHIERIKRVVERNCNSPKLGAELLKLRQGRAQLLELTNNQIAPDLLAYAALAETDGSGADPLPVARQMAKGLINVSKLLQDSNADTALLSLAAYKMGDPTRGAHPIHQRMAGRINHDTERNVWDLYRKEGLKDVEYDFIIRCLAFGIIAHEPKRFGLDGVF